MKKKSVKKTTKADKNEYCIEFNLNRIPAAHALTILLSSQVHVLTKQIIKEILYAMIASMLTINNFFEGDYREIKMNCPSVLQTALNNTYRKCLSTSVMQ